MNYKQIIRHMEGLKSWPFWQFGASWIRLALDTDSGCLYLTHRQNYQIKNSWQPIDDARLIIRPDDVLVLPEGDVSGTILGTLGIAGRFRNKTNGITHRRYYQHECMYNYEAICGLEINFKTGKPINAKRIDQLQVDKHAKMKIDGRVQELRAAYLASARMRQMEFVRNWNSVNSAYQNESLRDQVLIQCLTRLPSHWTNKIDESLRFFAASTKWTRDSENKAIPHDTLFDKMFNFHKSAVYRHFNVVH
jgi:hypothetical protein